jgi:hemerythrin
MPIINWNDGFHIGIKKFDNDHKRLIELLNRVYDNFIDGVSDNNAGEILEELVAYTKYHFGAEEHVMEKLDYPEMQKHKEEHLHFTGRAHHLKNLFDSGIYNLDSEMLLFLKGWLSFHILRSDAEFSKFIYYQLKTAN